MAVSAAWTRQTGVRFSDSPYVTHLFGLPNKLKKILSVNDFLMSSFTVKLSVKDTEKSLTYYIDSLSEFLDQDMSFLEHGEDCRWYECQTDMENFSRSPKGKDTTFVLECRDIMDDLRWRVHVRNGKVKISKARYVYYFEDGTVDKVIA